MARGDALARQWKIFRALLSSRRGKTVTEIATSLNLHIRTVYRDLDALQKAGFPIYSEQRGQSSFWKMHADDQEIMPRQLSF